MPKKKQTRWAIYIDESGDFGQPTDSVVVAGVLLCEDAPGYHPAELKRSLLKAAPGMPWPLHASAVTYPAFVALNAVHAAANRTKASEWMRPDSETLYEFQRVAAVLENDSPGDVASARERFKVEKEPDHAVLRRLSRRLRELEPFSASRLARHAREARAILGRQLADLATQSVAGFPACAVITAAETSKGDALGSETRDRYLTLLGCLAERVVDLLGRLPGEHSLGFRVQTRRVFNPLFGKEFYLQLPDLARIVGGLRGRAPRVDARAEAVSRYRGDLDVGYVLADFISNYARGVLDQSTAPLRRAENDLSTELGAPVRTGTPERSHLSASGAARTLIIEARELIVPAREKLPWRPGESRLWACEQAWEWAEGGRA